MVPGKLKAYSLILILLVFILVALLCLHVEQIGSTAIAIFLVFVIFFFQIILILVFRISLLGDLGCAVQLRLLDVFPPLLAVLLGFALVVELLVIGALLGRQSRQQLGLGHDQLCLAKWTVAVLLVSETS